MPREHLFRVTIDDCDVQTFRVGGHGGQHRDKTSAGVRIVHRASGARGKSSESRSQVQNKRTAFKRMAESEIFQRWARAEARRITGATDIGPTALNERIRTYNVIERRVTDHRIPFTSPQVAAILDGDLDELHRALVTAG